MIVTKAVNMAGLMNIPVLGLVENYSYFECPDCGKRHHIFGGEGQLQSLSAQTGIPVLAELPIDPKAAAAMDSGAIEDYAPNYLANVAALLDQNYN